MSAIITLALKKGQYVDVSTFESGVGLRCGCVCPECGEKVGSRIQSKETSKKSSYFHADEHSTCTGGQKETELHLRAKKIIESHTSINLPSSGTNKGKKFHYSEVITEKKIGNIRPDIVLCNDQQEQLLVEVAVTSFIRGNLEKTAKVLQMKIPTIEIDLKDIYLHAREIDQSIDQELTQILIEGLEKKTWIWNVEENSLTSSTEGQGTEFFRCIKISIAVFTLIKICKWVWDQIPVQLGRKKVRRGKRPYADTKMTVKKHTKRRR